MRACGTDDSSGIPMLESSSFGCAVDMNGDLLAVAGVSGCVREHSALQVSSSAAAAGEHFSLQVASSARRPVAERAQLGGGWGLALEASSA